jgi:hypothetical protein
MFKIAIIGAGRVGAGGVVSTIGSWSGGGPSGYPG